MKNLTKAVSNRKHGEFKALQQSALLGSLSKNGSMSRRQLSDDTGIAITSVCGRVKELMEKNKVKFDYTAPCDTTGVTVEYLTLVDRAIPTKKEQIIEMIEDSFLNDFNEAFMNTPIVKHPSGFKSDRTDAATTKRSN